MVQFEASGGEKGEPPLFPAPSAPPALRFQGKGEAPLFRAWTSQVKLDHYRALGPGHAPGLHVRCRVQHLPDAAGEVFHGKRLLHQHGPLVDDALA